MTFRLKTILGIAGIETVLLSLLIWFNLGALKSTSQSELENRVTATVMLFSAVAREAILASDLATLANLTKQLATLPGVRYVTIVNPDGVRLATSGTSTPEGIPAQPEKGIDQVSDGVWDRIIPLAVENTTYANIHLGFDVLTLQQAYIAAKNRSYIIAAVEILLVALFSYLLGSYLTNQLKQLKMGASRIAKWELDNQIPVEGDDELATTARAFNTMITEIKKHDAQQEAIMDSALDCIFRLDGTGRVVHINKAVTDTLGLTEPVAVNQDLCNLLALPSGTDHPLARALRERDKEFINKRVESQLQHQDGHIIPVEFVVVHSAPTGVEPFSIVYIADISDRKLAENMKDEFVATVSHELRTPLTAIQGALGMLAANAVKPESVAGQSLLQLAHSNCARLLAIVNDILDVKKIEAGKMEWNLNEQDLRHLAQRAVTENKTFAQKFSVTLQLQIDSDEALVQADELRIMQVMSNLLSNACKFSPKGAKVHIAVTAQDGAARFSVADNGPGIPADFGQRIFQKFSQADGKANRKHSGTGLGLSICKTIIEKHQGTISYQARPDGGTIFYFELPLTKAGQEPTRQQEKLVAMSH